MKVEGNMRHGRAVKLGTVLSGTMQNKDLIPAFVEELEAILGGECLRTREIKTAWLCEGYFESIYADSDLQTLYDELNNYAPPHCYFGALEGDGADYGFWPLNRAADTIPEFFTKWLQALSREQLENIYDWLVDCHLDPEECMNRIKAIYGVLPPCPGSFADLNRTRL